MVYLNKYRHMEKKKREQYSKAEIKRYTCTIILFNLTCKQIYT